MNESSVSIIVPIYNAENYIGRCIESLIAQTLKDIEIILVNDGSVDDTRVIIEEFAMKDKRIKVYNKENGGVSSARNLGIEKASAKLISFVDADDWCEKDMFEKMYKLYNESAYGLVAIGYTMEEEEGRVIQIQKADKFRKGVQENEVAEVLININLSYAVGKLYDTNIIKNNDIRFNTNLTLGEDALFVYDYILNINSAAVIDQALYHYVRCNQHSLSTKYIENIGEFIESVWDRKELLFSKFPGFKRLTENSGYKRDVSSTMMYIYNNYRKGCALSPKERRDFIKKFMSDKEVNNGFYKLKPHNFQDRLFFLLYKLKSPLIMDTLYSFRLKRK